MWPPGEGQGYCSGSAGAAVLLSPCLLKNMKALFLFLFFFMGSQHFPAHYKAAFYFLPVVNILGGGGG